MRLLVYAMQSSGASALTTLLAQKPDCAAFIDIWTMYAAPAVSGPTDTVAKVVVTTAFPLELHKARFRPDATILFLRHPVVTYNSLIAKNYANHNGFPEEKLAMLDRVFAAATGFDRIVYHEDLVRNVAIVARTCRAIGWGFDPGWARYPRSQDAIEAANRAAHPELRGRLEYAGGGFDHRFFMGDIEARENLADHREVVAACAPRLLAHYDALGDHQASLWQRMHSKWLGQGYPDRKTMAALSTADWIDRKLHQTG